MTSALSSLSCNLNICLRPCASTQVLGLDIMHSGILSVLPWITMAIMANVGGWIADTLVERGTSVTTVRKVGGWGTSWYAFYGKCGQMDRRHAGGARHHGRQGDLDGQGEPSGGAMYMVAAVP